jgi:alkylation response protein AidB-like acyl-CoA dehydrogenase
VVDSTRNFCEAELSPRILVSHRYEKPLDKGVLQKMGQHGLLGCTFPEVYGGAALSYVCYGLIASEVERIDSAYRSALSVQSSLVMYPIYAYGSDNMKRQYLPELAKGNLVGCFGLTVSCSSISLNRFKSLSFFLVMAHSLSKHFFSLFFKGAESWVRPILNGDKCSL